MRFERRLKPQTNVDLTPLIDVVLQLIIFFMITSVFKTAPGIELTLPKSATSQAVSLTEIHITAVSEQEIYVNKVRTELSGLGPILKKQLEGFAAQDLSVTVEGDQAATYQLMVNVLDELRRQGVASASLITAGKPAGGATSSDQAGNAAVPADTGTKGVP